MNLAKAAFLLPLLLAPAAGIPFTHVVVDANNPANPHCKAVGDLDGDGFPDIVVASSSGGGMHWYRWPSWTKTAIRASGSWTTDMQAADVDGDGDVDLVIPNASGVLWYRNPDWAEHTIGSQGANNHDVEVGDMNRDGRLDVVTRPKGGGSTNVWLQTNPTSWTRQVATTRTGEGTALGDIDNDGDLDLLHNGFWVENTNGAATAWSVHDIAAGWPADVGAVIADLNGDGRNDIVLGPSESSGKLSWYESATPRTGPWTEHGIDSTVSYLHTFKAADMDLDGDLDLVTAEMHQSGDPDEVSVYRNGGNGLSWTQQVVATSGSHNVRVADIDRDGDLDIVGTNWNESAPNSAVVDLWRNGLNPGDTLDSWTRHVVDASRPDRAIFVASGDLDGDGKKDIVSGAWWYRNPGSPGGAWTRAAIGSPLNNLAALHDFDGDGDLDILGTQGAGSSSNHNFAWARNNGSGSFTVLTNI
ncbi:MAG: VCBS repeat-containing protein, partial [Chloroflexi bacterium]|nr:VCBS repeat-containing protein [Chloroflexota bacterium]